MVCASERRESMANEHGCEASSELSCGDIASLRRPAHAMRAGAFVHCEIAHSYSFCVNCERVCHTTLHDAWAPFV